MFGNPETTPGGNAMKFYSSIRMDIRRVTAIKDAAGGVTGNRTRVKVVKNKLAPPFKVAEFDINFNEGISRAGSIIDVALDFKIIEKKGSWFSYGSEQLGQGRDALKLFLQENPDVQKKILEKIYEKVKSGAKPGAEDGKEE